jgi:DNA-binding NtrC family response regulator
MQKDVGHGGREQHLQACKGKVLVVDGDMEALWRYCPALQQQGYEVRCCASYTEGEACLRCELFDLVIVDQGSPAFEGRHVLERVIERDRHTPVLVLTRVADMPCYLEAMQLGAFDYLEKPVATSELGKLVATHARCQARVT